MDPEQPDLGEKKFSLGGFATAADAAWQDALKKRDQEEKFGGKVPALGTYADAWVEGLHMADSIVARYKKIIRKHVRPQPGHYSLDKIAPTRIARHYRELEQHGCDDEQDKGGPLSTSTVHKAHVVLGAILDAATLKAIASYKVARAELPFELARAEAYIPGDDDGQPRSPDAMTSRWDRRLKWAVKVKKFENLPRVTLKGLRHTHATILMELGVPPKVVQARLGYSTITTTMNIYSLVTPTLQKNTVDQFANRLAGA